MKIGVLMAACNAERYIRHALLSVLQQRGDAISVDIVVVDDGSTDGTADIVRSLGAPEIRLVTTPNQGVTRARNVALEHLSPDVDLYTWLDSDDLIPAGRFERDVGHFDDPNIQFVYGYMSLFDLAAADGLEPSADARRIDVRGVSLSAGLYRRQLAEAIGTFDADLAMAEDTDWLLRLFESTPGYRLIDDTCVYYRRHDANMTRDREVVRRTFMRAIAKSVVRRRRDGTATQLPRGIFEAADMVRGQPL